MPSVAAYNANDPYEQLIAQTIAIERQPQLALRAKQADHKIFKGVLSDFDSSLSALNTSLTTLMDAFTNPFAARAAVVPEGAGYTVSVTDDAAPGPHSLTVERLASTDARVSRRLDAEGTSLRDFFDAAGAQTFEIEVFSPTDDEPERRVAVSVTADSDADTDDDILADIRTAIQDAMDDAVSAGTISSEEAASASVINETSDTTRLSLRSRTTGYDGRLSFTDSDGGLLDYLQVNRAALASTEATTTTTTPATSASHTGQAVSVPTSISILNQRIEISINGTALSADLALGTYDTADDLAVALGDALGSDVSVAVSDGALQVTTVATGATSSLQITGGSALDTLGFEAMASAETGTDEVTTTETVSADESGGRMVDVGTSETDSALNAKFLLDGLTLYRGSNEVSDALDGMSFSLKSVGDETSFTVDTDGKAVRKEVESFIKKYNDVLGFIQRKTKVDPAAGTRGDFASDSSVRGLRFGMRTDMLEEVSGQPSGLTMLTDLGIEIEDDGTLTLADPDALESAARRNPGGVQSLFSDEDEGLGTRIAARLDAFLGTDGIIAAREESLEQRIERTDDQIERWDSRLAKREEALRLQYARFQETMALLQSQSDSVLSFFYGGF